MRPESWDPSLSSPWRKITNPGIKFKHQCGCFEIRQRKETMTRILLDGKALAQRMEVEMAVRVRKIKEQSNGWTPVLATILVGDDPASATYVRMKGNACKRVGME